MKWKDKQSNIEEGDGSILKSRKLNAQKLQLYCAKGENKWNSNTDIQDRENE